MIGNIVIGNTGEEVTLTNDGRGIFSYSKIDGIATPLYRNTSIVYAGRNGGRTPKQFYGQRVITIEGSVDEDNCTDHLQARKDLLAALSFDEDVPVKFYMIDGSVLQLMCKFEQPTLPITAKIFSDFQLIALANDYRFSDISSGAINSMQVDIAEAGGWNIYSGGWNIYSDGWKIYPSSTGINAQNAGNTATYPIIYIYDDAQNPIITNTTTGELIKVNITTSVGDVIKIDTSLRTATLNGGNINALVDATSTYFQLQPGDNLITYQTNTDGYAVVEWYNTYDSI